MLGILPAIIIIGIAGGIFILIKLPPFWDWIVMIGWLIFYFGQIMTYFIDGNGMQIISKWVETGDDVEEWKPNY